MAEDESSEMLYGRGGITYGAPAYEGQGYSAPYAVSSPVSWVTQSPVFSPTLSPVTTALSGMLPEGIMSQYGYGGARPAAAAAPGTQVSGDTMSLIIIGLVIAGLVVGVYMYTQRKR